ncbi:MAG: ASCH domain-containing protein [Fibrobacter sp.]|nr:ASCH domain-containing protein [Fibrobacter sp.]
MKEILMSIHHKWAQLIYSGEKTLELRKTAPKGFEKGEIKVYLYETDLKSITGVISVNFCHIITEITPKIVENSCLSLEEIEQYKAKGRGKLYGWEICGVDEYGPDWLYPEDLHIKRAPQSWQFVR